MGGCTSKPSKPNPYGSRCSHQNEYLVPPHPPKDLPPPLPPTTPFLPMYTPCTAHLNKPKTHSTPLRFLRRLFPPPPPAKHIRAVLRRRKNNKKAGIATETTKVDEEEEVKLDKRFGFSMELRSKLEVGRKLADGLFGYTCSAKYKIYINFGNSCY